MVDTLLKYFFPYTTGRQICVLGFQNLCSATRDFPATAFSESGIAGYTRQIPIMEAVYRYRNSDVKDFEVHPLDPRDESQRHENSRLVRRARQVGRLAGQAVVIARQTQGFIQEMRQRVREQGSELSAEVMARARNLGEEAVAEADAIRVEATDKAAELGRRVRTTAERTWQRGRVAVHEHPAEVVLGAGIVGFAVGVALRVGRSHRA